MTEKDVQKILTSPKERKMKKNGDMLRVFAKEMVIVLNQE